MPIIQKSIRTPEPQTFVDVTEIIRKAVRETGVTDAHILVSVPHTTAALTVNENADPTVISDILRRLEHAFPTHDRADRHSEGNSHAHLKSSMFGSCHPFIVHRGELLLGTWQGIFLCEFDGPRTRNLLISVPDQ